MLKLFLSLLLVSTLSVSFSQTSWADDDLLSSDVESGVRVENEYKIKVPKEQTEELWVFFKKNFAPESESFFLRKYDPAFSVTFAEEYFQDVYYDTSKLDMVRMQSGIRHRTRVNPDNPDDRKHGRQLVQIKLKRNDGKAENRTEVKYPVIEDTTQMDSAPPIGLIKKGKREEFSKQLEEVGISPYGLKEILTLSQKRRRVYISLKGVAFATITLDECVSKKWWKTYQATEIEMEINEIGYTNANPKERKYMEKMTSVMKDHLLKSFPDAKVDQTPKYNKVFNFFESELPLFSFYTRHLL